MKQLPFLIVTPAYQSGNFLSDNLKSIQSQQYPKLTHWVIDGGSTDKTQQILKKHPSVNWLSEPDRGQTHAINKGIKKLKQENHSDNAIFAYLNADDYYLPNTLKMINQLFQNHPKKAWVVGRCRIESDKHSPIHNYLINHGWKSLLRSCYSKSLLTIANPIEQPATFIRWSAVKQVGLFDESLDYTMDYDYWLRLQSEFGDPLFSNQTLAVFRIHQASKGGSQFKKQFAEQYQVARRYTQNKTALTLHRAHNRLVNAVYGLVK